MCMHTWYPSRPEEGASSSGLATENNESPCRHWKSNPSHLDKHAVLFTVELSLQLLLS